VFERKTRDAGRVGGGGGAMYVVKRDGRQESVHFDKITARLKKLGYGLSAEHCDPVLVAQKVCVGVYKGVTTNQIGEHRRRDRRCHDRLAPRLRIGD
jgi:hypothetical protein